MDPWYINRISNASATFQSGASASDYHQHLTGHQPTPSGNPATPSTPQLLLPAAAHNTSHSIAPSFNPGGFLTPNPYDFPLFSHASKASPYSAAAASQHRALAEAISSSKSPSMRENYSPGHHAPLSSSFFDHQNPAPSSIEWTHEASSLPSPFGVLPHESVTPSSADSLKTGSTDYAFNAYASPHSLSHLPQLSDYKNYADVKKASRSQSRAASPKALPGSSTSSPFYPDSSVTTALSETSSRITYSSKYSSSNTLQQHQSCIISSPSAPALSKDYQMQQSATRAENPNVYHDTSASGDKQGSSRSSSFVPSTKSSEAQHSIQSKAQSKVYPDLGGSLEPSHRHRPEAPSDSNRSSPAMMDPSASHRYPPVNSITSSSAKQIPSSTPTQRSANQQPYSQGLGHQTSAYRQYGNSGETPETDYTHTKPLVESAYSATSEQNNSDCASRRERTHASHSQPSPLSHVPSPAYPVYHSPMAAMSSPSPLHQSEISNTCHENSNSFKAATLINNATSPLDVPVTRSQDGQPQNVAYPSVITRALNTPDPVAKPGLYSDVRPYDRGHDSTTYPKICWDSSSESLSSVSQQPTSSSQHRKYPSPNTVPVYNANSQEITANVTQPQQNSSRAAERQHSYYDGTAADPSALQDLSSCRGDPMSIVKNLHHVQQQTCQASPSVDDSQSGGKMLSADCNSAISTNKRRKSTEKQSQVPNSTDYYSSRVPPPAHHNVSYQQQQNGSYFPNYLSSSTPSTSRSYPGSQSHLNHASNTFLGNQSQGIYVGPYFTPFHSPGSVSTSAPSTSSTATTPSQTSATSDNQSSNLRTQYAAKGPSTHPAPSVTTQMQVSSAAVITKVVVPDIEPSTHPAPSVTTRMQVSSAAVITKVVVPDIEEELSFLDNLGPILMAKIEPDKKSTGFEESYMKFLQGKRETSPPPTNRGIRKTVWTNPKSLPTEPPSPSAPSTSGSTVSNGSNIPPDTTPPVANPPVYDVEDDPRYFPLPKTAAQRRSFDTSDSDSDVGLTVQNQSVKTQDRKPIAAVAPRTANKQSSKVTSTSNQQPGKRGRKKKPQVPMPRRETSKRKAKEKKSVIFEEDDLDYPAGRSDSDSDPAWTPVAFKAKAQNVELSDDENCIKKSHKKGCGSSPLGRKRGRGRLPVSDDETSQEEEAKQKKRHIYTAGPKGRRRSLPNGNEDETGSIEDGTKITPFKVGDFVVIRSDMKEQWPPIWRVDGNTLLQKFEPFVRHGEKLYRNIQTYSGWSSQNQHIYRSIPVKYRSFSRMEMVVEFIQNDLNEENDNMLESFIKETAKYQDNFEVYIQTLISQALDSNFLTEIFQEQDEYFLSNVKTVDDIVGDKRQQFLSIVKWRTELEASIATWPCFNVLLEMQLTNDEFHKTCTACGTSEIFARVILYGQPYNSTTLEGCQADPKLVSEKNLLTCKRCLSRIELYNKVAHQKYLMFIECAKRVQDKRGADPSKDTTVILNELLADDKWLNELFCKVRMSWAEIDCMEQLLPKE